ncbi:MAG: flagellin FliC [Candidatus Dadabacteria bacterium]|nr:MAG: flagellin FliC [Candidatus Dadabacteria bacterium]
MTLTLASNIASVRSQRQLQQTTSSLGKTFERLSSGLRINSAADDPAGLALADNLRADARIASVAIRNANDGLSQTQIADAALDEIGNILQRMAELAEQSANGVYTNSQRSALSSEFLALGSEIDRIAKTTEFNNVTLLSNSSSVTLQVGLDGTVNSQITIEGVLGTLDALGLASSGSSKLTYSIIDSTTAASQSASQNALSAVNSAIDTLAAKRGTLGAAESRLNSAINYLTVARENFVAADSRIRDADIAQEVADMVRLQVLQQAGTAVLAQANLQPQVALALLQ